MTRIQTFKLAHIEPKPEENNTTNSKYNRGPMPRVESAQFCLNRFLKGRLTLKS
jgi:hypothetical protein